MNCLTVESSTKMKIEQQYIELFRENSAEIAAYSAAILNKNRQQAFEQFCEIGFPNRTEEAYIYSRVQEALATDFGLNFLRFILPIEKKSLFSCNVQGIKSATFFMANDYFFAQKSTEKLPENVIFCSLTEACKKFPELVENYFGKQISAKKDGFLAFNQAFAQEGFFLFVPKNTTVDVPIQLINLLHGKMKLMNLSRNLIVVGENASLRLLMCDHTANETNYFNHSLTEIFVENNAKFDLYTLESTHAKTTALKQIFVSQKADSQVVVDTIGLNNGTTRNHIEIDLNGENAQTWLGGMAIADNRQKIENFTAIRHNVPRCTSNELYKYILDGEAEGAFSGRMVVAKNAQKTAAYQTNRNICLTKTAKMHAKPQLEIYADDVKCGHGATTGQLDETALFYMQTRGIGKAEARMLLLLAFTSEVLQRIDVEPLREQLRLMTERRLRGEQLRCKGCTKC